MKKKLYLIVLPLLLTACSTDGNGTSGAGDSSAPVAGRETFESVLDAVSYLKESKNYTLDVVLTRDGSKLDEFDVSYTEDGYYFGITDGEYGYKKVNDGVFAYEIYGSEFYFSELLEEDGVKYTDIWTSGLITSFANWKTDDLDQLAGKGGVIKAKDSRISMLEMTGFDTSYYPYVESASAYINDDGTFYFTYDMDVDSYFYTVKASVLLVGGTVTEKVNGEMAKGRSYLVPDASLVKARDLFRGNNFTHIYYDENGEEAAWEKFHPEYYSITVDSAYNASHQDSVIIPASYVKIDNKYVPAAGRVLRGVYYCTIRGTGVSLMVGPNGEGYNNVPDMVRFLHYPRILSMWGAFEFATKEETALDGFDETWRFSRTDLAQDAADNMGLTTVLTNAGTYAVSLQMSLKNINASSAKVSFRIVAENGQYQDFEFSSFGTTKEEALDNLLTTFQDPEEN